MRIDKWSDEETQQLASLVERLGQRWCLVAEQLPLRNSKQCRRRWKNVIALPERKDTPWTHEEDHTLAEAFDSLGPKWTDIARRLTGRTDNAVKNRWSLLHKRKSSTRAEDEYEDDDDDDAAAPRASKRRRTGLRPLPAKRESSSSATLHDVDASTADPFELEPMPRVSQHYAPPPPPSAQPCPHQAAHRAPAAPPAQADPSDQTLFLQRFCGTLHSSALDTCTSGISRYPSGLPELLGAPSFSDPLLDPDLLFTQPSGLTPIMHHFYEGAPFSLD